MPLPLFLSRTCCWPALLLAGMAATARAQDCSTLTSLQLTDTVIGTASVIAAGSFEQPGGGRGGRGSNQAFAALPAFCRVEATARPAPESVISIEVWLPTQSWNGKLQGVGNGAWAGTLSYTGMATALAAGYAVASTDGGHRGVGTDFLLEDPDKLVDFAYRAIHEMTVTAKAVTAAYYQRPQSRSYFTGCSTGGLQAMAAAWRYPDDYDGIVAGAPNYFASHIQGTQVWTAAIANRSADAQLGETEFGLINTAAVAACDANDGVRDGVIEAPALCGFDPAELACPAGGVAVADANADADADAADADGAADATCLNPAQIETVRRIYQGPVTGNGNSIYPGLARGSESGWATLASDEPLSIASETYELLVYRDREWDWRDFDADIDIATAVERIGPLLDSNDGDLRPFVDRGGKLLLYHGWSDPGIPPAGTVRYFEGVQSTLGAEGANDAVRLFMVPGMGHCAGGTGTDRFDAIASLDRWLETGTPPARIEAERIVEGERIRSRPLCPYPTVANYTGTGSTDDAGNFVCR